MLQVWPLNLHWSLYGRDTDVTNASRWMHMGCEDIDATDVLLRDFVDSITAIQEEGGFPIDGNDDHCMPIEISIQYVTVKQWWTMRALRDVTPAYEAPV